MKYYDPKLTGHLLARGVISSRKFLDLALLDILVPKKSGYFLSIIRSGRN